MKNTILELDDVFAALGHPRRRYLLYTLAKEGDETELSELATKIAAWEQDKSPGEITDEERKRVQTALYHSHIPELTRLNALEFRKEEDAIVRTANTPQVERVLDGAGAELDGRQEIHAKENDA